MLNQIKEDFKWGLKVGGSGHNNLDDEQVVWLIEQAEKLNKIEYEIDHSDMSTGVENITNIVKG